MMDRLETIKIYYETNMGQNLPDYRVLGWESEEAQQIRFDALLSSVDMEGKEILDVGCGLGNLLEHITRKGVECSYTGVDVLESMIECVRQKNLNADFHCVDIFKNNPFEKESFDVVYASGIFNLNLGNNKEFLEDAFELFLDLSRDVVAFNLLHCDSPSREDTYYYFHPDEVNQIVEKLSHRVGKMAVIEHYLQNDFTVVCYKQKPPTV